MSSEVKCKKVFKKRCACSIEMRCAFERAWKTKLTIDIKIMLTLKPYINVKKVGYVATLVMIKQYQLTTAATHDF